MLRESIETPKKKGDQSLPTEPLDQYFGLHRCRAYSGKKGELRSLTSRLRLRNFSAVIPWRRRAQVNSWVSFDKKLFFQKKKRHGQTGKFSPECLKEARKKIGRAQGEARSRIP